MGSLPGSDFDVCSGSDVVENVCNVPLADYLPAARNQMGSSAEDEPSDFYPAALRTGSRLSRRFLADHAFRFAARDGEYNPKDICDALRGLSRSRVESYFRCVPPSWTPTSGIRDRMIGYLRGYVSKADALAARLVEVVR